MWCVWLGGVLFVELSTDRWLAGRPLDGCTATRPCCVDITQPPRTNQSGLPNLEHADTRRPASRHRGTILSAEQPTHLTALSCAYVRAFVRARSFVLVARART